MTAKKKLIDYLKPYWLFAVLSPLFMAAEVIVDLFQPKLMSQIVDNGVFMNDGGYILKTLLHMLLLAVIGGITGVGAAGFASAASQSFGNDLRKDAFARVMSLSLQQTDSFTTGSLVTRLTNDITAVQELVAMSLRMFIRAPLMFAGGIVMAVSLNIRFGLVLILALPIQILVLWLVLSKASPLFSVVQSKLDKVNSVVQENILGARMVKAYVREDYELNRFDRANTDLMQNTLRVQKLMALLHPFIMIVMNLSVVAILYIGGLQVEARTMQVGQIMAAVTYVTQILMSIMMVSMMFQSISRARASAARIREILYTEPAILGGNKKLEAPKGQVVFKDVSFHYPGAAGRPVLTGVDLEIRPGETLAILGATGSGKTSLINLIPRFYDTTGGTVLLDGRDVREYELESLRGTIGCVLQKSELFSGTIRDNIRWGNEEADNGEVEAAARTAQAHDYIQSFSQGYDTVIGEKGTSLSGGQKQRLAIARAILKKPAVLIFDDSTSALDLGTEARLQKALREHLKDTTVIMIAQRVASVMNADRIAVLDNGSLCACGAHAELMATSAVYRDIYSSQIKKEV